MSKLAANGQIRFVSPGKENEDFDLILNNQDEYRLSDKIGEAMGVPGAAIRDAYEDGHYFNGKGKDAAIISVQPKRARLQALYARLVPFKDKEQISPEETHQFTGVINEISIREDVPNVYRDAISMSKSQLGQLKPALFLSDLLSIVNL